MDKDTRIYQERLKNNIKTLVESGRLEEAKELLSQYESIVATDIEVYSIKGVITIMEGEMKEAQGVLTEGLKLNNRNFNLLYNLAYVYQLKGDDESAILTYKKAMKNAEDEESRVAAYEALQGLGVKGSKEGIMKEKRPKVLFLPYYENTWDSLKSVYEAFATDPQFDTEIVIIPINRNTPTGDMFIWEDYLTPQGIQNTHYEKYSFELDKPDIVFYNNPYDGVNLPQFTSKEIKKHAGLMVYVPYYLDSIPSYLTNESIKELYQARFGLEGHNNADIIISGNEWVIKNIKIKNMQFDNRKKCIALGNPKTDFLFSYKGSDLKDIPEWEGKRLSGTTFMLNTHYTVATNNYKCLDIIEQVIRFIDEDKNSSLIWRPHPQTFFMLENRKDQVANKFKHIMNTVTDSKRMILDTTGSAINAYMYSDALISTSRSSIVFEALFLNIPTFLSVQNPIYNNNIKILNATPELKQNTLYLEDVVVQPRLSMKKTNDWNNDIIKFMQDIIEGKDINCKGRELFIKQAFKNGNGSCGEQILEYIKKLIRENSKQYKQK